MDKNPNYIENLKFFYDPEPKIYEVKIYDKDGNIKEIIDEKTIRAKVANKDYTKFEPEPVSGYTDLQYLLD